jgi:hypothetical protein
MPLVSAYLSQAQIDQIVLLRAAANQGDQSIKGKWQPVYEFLYQAVTVNGGPKAEVLRDEWLWALR